MTVHRAAAHAASCNNKAEASRSHSQLIICLRRSLCGHAPRSRPALARGEKTCRLALARGAVVLSAIARVRNETGF